jgi:hypothetical protein
VDCTAKPAKVCTELLNYCAVQKYSSTIEGGLASLAHRFRLKHNGKAGSPAGCLHHKTPAPQ